MTQQAHQSRPCCCGCCTLRSGSLIILWMFLIVDVSSIFDYAGKKNEDGYFGFSLFSTNFLEVNLIAVALCGLKIADPQLMIPYISLSVLEIAAASIALLMLLISTPAVLHSGIIEYGFTFTYRINQTSVYNITVNDNGNITYESSPNGKFTEIITSTTAAAVIAVIISIYIAIKGFATTTVYRYYKELVEETHRHRDGDNKENLVYIPRNSDSAYVYSQSEPPQPPPFSTGTSRLSSTFEEHKI